jgi:predicted transcriptional regulator
MLAASLITATYPNVHLKDKAGYVLQLMEDYDVQHLPVIAEDKFIGMVSKDDVLDIDEKAMVAVVEMQLIKSSVLPDQHFTQVLKIAVEKELSIIPVVNTHQELTGVIKNSDVLKATANYLGTDEPGGLLVLEMEKRNYSFGEITRLIETNDAYITQFNTAMEPSTGLLLVAIKINKIEISDILATFQRYEYVIRYYFGEETYENELKNNYDLLMNYLSI